MQRNPKKLLHDMQDACTFLLELTPTHSLADLRKERVFRSAAERELMVIGEALFVLNRHFPEIASQITEYNRIIRFRHVLVHGYDIVDPEITWTILTEKLPVLRHELERLLDSSL